MSTVSTVEESTITASEVSKEIADTFAPIHFTEESKPKSESRIQFFHEDEESWMKMNALLSTTKE